jgi:FKBP-type peptidyl-prolyl cis-trans isomerase FklB
MRLAFHAIGVCLMCCQGFCSAAQPPELASETDRISYSLGHQLGRDLQRQGVQADMKAILRGLEDGLAGETPLLPAGEMETLLKALKQNIVTTQQEDMQHELEERRRKREQSRQEGAAFLATNAKKPGVTTLPSGLQYRVIKAGQGRRPALTDTVTVNYHGRLINGNEFGSTRAGAPERFSVNEVIPGLEEALLLMPQGSKWELYIPPELGFGRRGALEDQTLIYEIELLDIGVADTQDTATDSGRESDPG